ncbi:hypothetical protein OS787_02520 [Pediococcus pentosaceus]|uniref:hypothetical protein n=1 Tax=Pediococcus pentosaceus TaxID=1255 RepID=UPI003D8006B2
MADRVLIDPAKFAIEFDESISKKDVASSEILNEAKKYLLSYLTAFYLIEDFNKMENSNFNSENEKNLKIYLSMN